MQDFEKLSEEEQQEIILSIGNKLTDKERWYWMGLIHLLRTSEDRINRAIEYIKEQVHRNQQFYEMDRENLLEILKGEDKSE